MQAVLLVDVHAVNGMLPQREDSPWVQPAIGVGRDDGVAPMRQCVAVVMVLR